MYVSPVLFYHNTGVLINPFIQFGDTTQFIWHGWLYPTILGSFPGTGDVLDVGTTMNVVAFVSTCLFVVLIFKNGMTWQGAALLPAIYAVTLYQITRPELISTPLIILGMLALSMVHGDDRRFSIVFVIAASLIALVHPHMAFFCCFAYFLYMIGRSETLLSFIRQMIIVAVLILAIIVVATELHPQLSFVQWVSALLGMASLVSVVPPGPIFVPYYITAPAIPLAIVYLLSLPLAGFALWRDSKDDVGFPGRRIILSIGMILFMLFIWFYCVRTLHATYLIGIAPLLLWTVHRSAVDPGNPTRRLAQALIVVMMTSGIVALTYRSAINVTTKERGVSLQQFQRGLAILDTETVRIGTGNAMVNIVAAGLPKAKVVLWPRVDMFAPTRPEPDFNTPPPLLITQQSNTGDGPTAAAPPGYKVMVDTFNTERPTVMGRAIGRTFKDYAYAILCRLDYCPILQQHIAARGRAGASKDTGGR